MSFTPQDPQYAAKVAESFARQDFMATLGAELVDVQPGAVRIELPYRKDLTQQHDYMHAGAISAIADSACGYAALSLTPPGAAVLAVEFQAKLMRPAMGQRFYVVGKVLKPGRTLTFCMGEVVAIDGDQETVVATLTSTIMTLEGRGIAN